MDRNHVGGKKWLAGVIVSQSGPVSFQVSVNGQLRRCYLDQLKLKSSDSNSKAQTTDSSGSPVEDVDLPSSPEIVDCPRDSRSAFTNTFGSYVP